MEPGGGLEPISTRVSPEVTELVSDMLVQIPISSTWKHRQHHSSFAAPWSQLKSALRSYWSTSPTRRLIRSTFWKLKTYNHPVIYAALHALTLTCCTSLPPWPDSSSRGWDLNRRPSGLRATARPAAASQILSVSYRPDDNKDKQRRRLSVKVCANIF